MGLFDLVRFVTVAPPKSDASLFHLVLIKPTHYDADGYPYETARFNALRHGVLSQYTVLPG